MLINGESYFHQGLVGKYAKDHFTYGFIDYIKCLATQLF